MRYTLRFLPEVEDDIMTAYEWYKTKSDTVHEDFLRSFYTAAYEITQNPLLYRKIHKKFRRCLLRRFPYALYFIIDSNTVIVFGVFHCARNPQHIQRTLHGRDR